jgi:mRNA-degrading endonuclease RelE of RelBE toxin-antitoxin system
MVYEHEYEPLARRQLRRLSARERERIRERVIQIAESPRGRRSKQLKGRPVRWSSQVGDMRIIYRIDDDARKIAIQAVGNRGNIYELMRRRS